MNNQRITAKTFHDASFLLLREMMEEEESHSALREISPGFRERMETLLRQGETKKTKKTRARSFSRRFWRAAVVIIVIFLSWMAIDRQARASVVGWLKSVVEGVFRYSFTGSAVDDEMPVYRLGWYPEGGEVKQERDIPERKYAVYVEYKDGKGFSFSYGVFDEGTVIHVDPLGHKIVHSIQRIRGKEVEVYYDTVTWDSSYLWLDEKNNLYFDFWSMLDHETNIRIIESIIKNKQ